MDEVWETEMLLQEFEVEEVGESLNTDGINELRESQIIMVESILEIPRTTVEKLLAHMKWDYERLLLEYVDNQEELLNNAQVTQITLANIKEGELVKPGIIDCTVCFMDAVLGDFTGLSCCHYFCNECWSGHIKMNINNGNVIIPCMERDCLEMVPDIVVKELVNEEYYNKFTRYTSQTFVSNNLDLQWCIAPGCERAISKTVKRGAIIIAECDCGLCFCVECKREAHPPVPCELVNQWEKIAEESGSDLSWLIKNKVDNDTLKWMQENTKACPSCDMPVQKNKGCYQMTCSSGCGNTWCWLCRKDWAPTHSNHFKCATYNSGRGSLTDKPKHKDKKSYKKKKKLNEAAEYFRSFNKYEKLAEDDMRVLMEDQSKIEELKRDINNLDENFLRNGRYILKHAVLSLKYSYVRSYFFDSDLLRGVYKLRQDSTECARVNLAEEICKPACELDIASIRLLTNVLSNAVDSLYVPLEEE
eukprot:TRINITY_DN5495_c3_g1_i2.p1 TRINITY_DN5495_c3_g1~~TRINITY_DN5495_c3_g1_i2.p1  ORF type:complete len:475 (+),score=97.93 TRINITY_DN5495_c3_g1_i2:539-1963(+)